MPLPPPDSELHRLMTQFPRAGEVRWIGLRPARDVAMQAVDSAEAVAGEGTAMPAAAASVGSA